MSGKPDIHKVLTNLGIASLNAIQEATLQSLPFKDLLLLSPTGSGKTVAFLLPLLHRLEPGQAGIQALVLAPSRELALQIERVFRNMQTGFKVTCCYGGHDMASETQALAPSPSVLIGTPGRILDHLQRQSITLQHCTQLVLDEFDKLLEFGFEEEMTSIVEQMPAVSFRTLTSATTAIELPDFLQWHDAHTLDFLEKDPVASRLHIRQVPVAGTDKSQALFQLLCTVQPAQALVFCNERETAEQVNRYLEEQGIYCECYHGGLEQQHRESALCKFRNGSVPYLVTTDLASRGLDIPDMGCVIHYDLPPHEETFVHRNGRTARVGNQGEVFILRSQARPLPSFIPPSLQALALSKTAPLPPAPLWATLFIGAGKKEKISKADIAGFLSKRGGLGREEIGLIEVKDHYAFVAVTRKAFSKTLKQIQGQKIKNIKARYQAAR